jgi:dGTP triphosphohydrolase
MGWRVFFDMTNAATIPLRTAISAWMARGTDELDPGFAGDWREAADDAARKRVIVDQVASLTDQSAIAWYERLCARPVF